MKACHGNCANFASSPPIMRFINIRSLDNPHSSPKSSMRFCRIGNNELSSLILFQQRKSEVELKTNSQFDGKKDAGTGGKSRSIDFIWDFPLLLIQ